MFCKERKRKQDQVLFDALLANPGDLVAGIALPANAKLYASSSLAATVPVPVVNIGADVYHISNAAANDPQPLQYVEKFVTVSKAAGAAGTVTLYIEGPFGTPLKIAQG